jgi:hypothetical protein
MFGMDAYKKDILPENKKIHYCGAGSENVFGIDIWELDMNAAWMSICECQINKSGLEYNNIII